jgi:hypothetical protein
MKICQRRYDACFKTTTLPTCRLGHGWRVRHIREEFGSEKAGQRWTRQRTSVKRAYKAGKRVLSVKKDLKCFGANENTCRLNYYSGKSIKKGDWNSCQLCKTLCHEFCVSAFREKTFTCTKRNWSKIVLYCGHYCTACGPIYIIFIQI